MFTKSLNLLYEYYTSVCPNPKVLELCGIARRDMPYTANQDHDLTVIINAYARPDYLPLIWEAIQYQSRRPQETWIVQNNPKQRSRVPRDFFEQVRTHGDTVVIDSDLNHGCWFRFFLAALYCQTRYVAIFDDDTLPGQRSLEAALDAMAQQPGLYGGRGITLKKEPDGPRFWSYDVSGWPVGTMNTTEVDFVGHMWVMETIWLKDIFKNIPERLFIAPDLAQECGEDMYISFVAQKQGIKTFVYGHGRNCSPRWSSIQAYEMGLHPNAMNLSGGLNQGDAYLRHFLKEGWKLLQYRNG